MVDLNQAVDYVLRWEDSTLSGRITVDDGGRTRWGIAEKDNPDAWKDGPPSLEQARQIYIDRYIKPYQLEELANQDILNYLADCCVNQGPGGMRDILREAFHHFIEAATMSYMIGYVNAQVPYKALDSLRRARTLRYARLVKARPADVKYLVGWVERALP